jgi:uncharacterized protein YprB with RNaseH-like and TPR domain
MKQTKYKIAQEEFIKNKMSEVGCGRRKANGLWMKSQERFNIVFEHELKKDTSQPTIFESNDLHPDDVGLF